MSNRHIAENPRDSRYFKNIRAFTRTDVILGLPSMVFVTGISLSLGLGVALHWYVSLFILLAYFPVMFTIHKDDPQALKLWIRTLSHREYVFRGGYHHHYAIIWL
ncbi:MAG: VirB3 family type IV secretion system protein [Alphaproteobacteria bacterium]|nr:VirB3 family type IV secretion system protein [Alphaproteobacteria bacterium]